MFKKLKRKLKFPCWLFFGTHIETTGPEIWEDTDGKVDIFVAGFVPDVLDIKIYDEIIAVENEDVFSMGKFMRTKEGDLNSYLINLGLSDSEASAAVTSRSSHSTNYIRFISSREKWVYVEYYDYQAAEPIL